MEKIIYPIGRGKLEEKPTPAKIVEWINDIEKVPDQLDAVVSSLSDEQLDTPYREEGWTIRQIVHHISDSNINSYIRFKLAVTEDSPTIKTWDQTPWAQLDDAKTLPVDVSINLLRYLHIRWVYFLRTLTEEDHARTFIHPEGGEISVGENVWNYSWHSRHHVAQIASTIERFSW